MTPFHTGTPPSPPPSTFAQTYLSHLLPGHKGTVVDAGGVEQVCRRPHAAVRDLAPGEVKLQHAAMERGAEIGDQFDDRCQDPPQAVQDGGEHTTVGSLRHALDGWEQLEAAEYLRQQQVR